MYNFNHDGEKFKLRISNVRYSVDEVDRTVTVKATVGVRAPKFVLNTVQLHQMPEGTTPESVYPFGLDGHEGVEMEAVAHCSKSDEFNTEVGKRVAMAKLEAAAHRRFSKSFMKWAKRFLEYAGNLYSSVEEFAEKCSEVESGDDLYIRCMTGKYPDGRYRWPHEFEGFTGGGDPGRNSTVRVVELITEKRLVELYNSGSKPDAFRAEDMGDGIFKVTYRGGYEVADEPGATERLMSEHDAVEFLKTADRSGIEVLSAVRSMWRFEDDGRPIYRVRWTVPNPDHEVSPEELNTGPDTTENINEVVESDDRRHFGPRDGEPFEIPADLTHGKVNGVRRTSSGWTKERNADLPGVSRGEKPTKEDVDAAWTPIYDQKTYRRIGFSNALTGERKYTTDDGGSVVIDARRNKPGGDCKPVSQEQAAESLEKTREAEHILSLKSDLSSHGEADADKETEGCNKNVSRPADYYHYGRILERMDDTHRRKNSDYGDAAYKGYKKYGDYYFLTQLHNKFTRLENLTINNEKPQVEDESVDDTLLDMANYAVMYLESRHRND